LYNDEIAVRQDPHEERWMRNGLLLGVLGFGVFCVAGWVPGGEAPGRKGPVWLTDYAAARKAARASGKPILAVFR
jgi:hypothetical protein